MEPNEVCKRVGLDLPLAQKDRKDTKTETDTKNTFNIRIFQPIHKGQNLFITRTLSVAPGLMVTVFTY